MKITIELDPNNPSEKQDAEDMLKFLKNEKAEIGLDDCEAPVFNAVITELERVIA